MATTILIRCPECDRQIKAPDNVLGKKVRCKYCQAAFVARKGPATPPPGKPAKPAKTAKPPAGKPARPADEEEEDSNPYGVRDMDFAYRCPNCANEMESEDAVICLHCGYNTATRQQTKMRKTYDTTVGEWILWLLPGVACALAVLTLIGFDVWYLMKIDEIIDKENDSWYLAMWAVGGIKLWIIIMSLFGIYLAGKFAIRRLILHPRPPEVEKVK